MHADRWFWLSALMCGYTAAACAAPVCANCHPKQTARFLASPMGKSIAAPEPIESGRVTHSASGSVLSAENRNGRMFHVLAERGITAEYPVAYQIGSGIKGKTYAVQVGEYLLESPLSWFQSGGWDVSPGYESMRLIDFDRPITSSCLFCHSGKMKFDDADGRRLSGSRLEAITCGRCHGDGETHSRRPSSKNIVNPAKLSGAARDSICEQCHLEGDARFVNPGKSLEDFRPGEPLERTMVTYLLHREKRAVSQVEELAESECARSGKMWCGSCHDPHGPAVDVAQVCRSCHAAVSKAAHPAGQTKCASCHMQPRNTTDIAHVAVTDHHIRRPGSHDGSRDETRQDGIVAWREPSAEYRQRDRALAELLIGSKEKGVKMLEALPEAQQNGDPDVLSALEAAFLETSPPDRALALAGWAVEALPKSANFALNYGLALKRAGNLKQAEREFLRSIELDPSLMRSYAELAILYDSKAQQAEAMAIIDRFLKWNPQTIQFRLARRP